MDQVKALWRLLQGRKTYIVAVSMVVVGIYKGDVNIILEGLALAGLRNGLSIEMASFIVRKKK